MLHPGDVYAGKLSDGRYGAVRILQVSGKSSIVYTTQYLGDNLPLIDDPTLLNAVMQKRFSFGGWPARTWLDGKPPKNFQYVGCIPLTDSEKEIKCLNNSGKWIESTGNEILLEWRWLHDRNALQDEMKREQERIDRRPPKKQKPRKMLDADDFWSIIALFDWNHLGDDESIVRPAIESLKIRSKSEICRFQERLSYLLYQLDTIAHASHIGEISYDPKTGSISVDSFLYVRCVAVCNGKTFYESALQDPHKMPKDMEFEILLSVASRAYELKTGQEFEYSTGCSYETFSNLDGWKK